MSEIKELPIENIISDNNQPRKSFDKNTLQELGESIKQYGMLQPILVRPIEAGKYQLVHGERRWRACKLIGLKYIKAEVRKLSDREVLEIQLVENLQREDLDPIEEAETYARMVNELKYTHKELAKKIGKSREYVTNKLRLLKLPNNIRRALQEGKITESHARALISLDESKQKEVLNKISTEGLNVRQVEEIVKNNRYVSRETLIEDRMLLIPIPSKVYNILTDFAKQIKHKPEVIIITEAILAFIKKEG